MGPEAVEIARSLGPFSAGAVLLSFAAWLLYRYSRGAFISEREWAAGQAREARLEEALAAEREAHRETREALREALTQNGMLIQASTISTEVMRRLDQRAAQAQEGGGS